MIELPDLTEKLKNELNELIKKLEETRDPEATRELCLSANHLLMTYNLETWNKIYRKTLPNQEKREIKAPHRTELEFEMPPV